MRRRGTKAVSDERVLGSSEFVMRLFSQAEQREKEMLRFSVKVPDLGSLAGKIAKGEGISEPELRSGGRREKISKARRLFC